MEGVRSGTTAKVTETEQNDETMECNRMRPKMTKPDNQRRNAMEGNGEEMRYVGSWDDKIVSKKGGWQGLTRGRRGRQQNGKEKITEKRMQPQKRDIRENRRCTMRHIVVFSLQSFPDFLEECPVPRFQKTKKSTYPVLNRSGKHENAE